MKCKACGGQVVNGICKGCGFPIKKTVAGKVEVSTKPVETDEEFVVRMEAVNAAFKIPEGEVLIGKK